MPSRVRKKNRKTSAGEIPYFLSLYSLDRLDLETGKREFAVTHEGTHD